MSVSYRAAQTLIKRNNEPAFRGALSSGLDPNAANQNGWTLLMLCAVEGNIELAQALLDRGASTNNRNDKKENALSIAIAKGQTEFAEFLKANGAS